MVENEAPRRPTTMHRVKPGDKTGPALLVPSSTIRDENLTPDALYLLIWMLDHPPTWNYQKGYVWENSKLSRNRIYAAIKLLRELRYCLRRGAVDEKGHKSFTYEWFATPYPTLEESVLSAANAKAEVIPESGTPETDGQEEVDEALRAPAGETEFVDTDGLVLDSLSVPDPGSRNQGLPLQKKPPQRVHADSRTDLMCRLGKCEAPGEHQAQDYLGRLSSPLGLGSPAAGGNSKKRKSAAI
jgi:hypothetical protein